MLSASGFYRNRNCLKSEELEREAQRLGNAPPENTLWSLRGTRVHAGEGETPDERAAYNFVSYRLETEMRKYIGPAEIRKEERLYLRENLEPIFTGKPDRYAVNGVSSYSVVFGDMKPGFEPDWEAWWTQMTCYAVLFKQKYRQADSIIGIIATRFFGIQTRHFDLKDLELADLEIRSVAAIHRDGTSALKATPGPWCKYCRARLICTVAMLPALPKETELEYLPAGAAGAEVVEKLQLIIKLARDRLEWYKEKLKNVPDYLDGKFFLASRKVPEIRMDKDTIDALELLLSPEQIYQCASLSAPKLREALCVTNHITEKEAKDTLDLALGNLITYKESPWLQKK